MKGEKWRIRQKYIRNYTIAFIVIIKDNLLILNVILLINYQIFCHHYFDVITIFVSIQ